MKKLQKTAKSVLTERFFYGNNKVGCKVFLSGPPTRRAILLYLTTLSLKSIGGDTLTDGIVSFGREKIYTDYDVVTAGNVLDILEHSFDKHSDNAREIDYLYEYYKGNQPVLNRTKEYREEILNKIVVNRANMIVDFNIIYLYSIIKSRFSRPNFPGFIFGRSRPAWNALYRQIAQLTGLFGFVS